MRDRIIAGAARAIKVALWVGGSAVAAFAVTNGCDAFVPDCSKNWPLVAALFNVFAAAAKDAFKGGA